MDLQRLGRLRFSEDVFPGVLIVYCGLDGSGKTSLIQRLVADLDVIGLTPFVTKQPTDAVRQSPLFRRVMYTPNYSDEIEYRSHSLITVADRVQHSLRVILPALRAGQVVVSDRYFFSAIANLRARGYTNDLWIYEIGNLLPKPDAAIFCEPPMDLIEARLAQREEERGRFFDVEFNRRLYDEFRHVRQEFGGALPVDSSTSVDETHAVLRPTLSKLLESKIGVALRE